jgi:hypothetical protein
MGGGETPTLLGPLEKGNLDYWTIDRVKNYSNSDYCSPLSEPFRIYKMVGG